MDLSTSLKKSYTKDQMTAIEARQQAEFIAWGPVVFQVSRLMEKFGIFEMLLDSDEGMTREEIVEKSGLSDYAVKCLLDASLCIGTVIVDVESDRFSVTKLGWFLHNDVSTRVNMSFNHDINYKGMFNLEESFKEGRPVGLKSFGDWPTIYEGLSQLPEQALKSWLDFDHFYSDTSFPQALELIFSTYDIKELYDVGGNTGKWALQCVDYDPNVKVTILDLPQQIAMMKENVKGNPNSNRISGYPINLLNPEAEFPVLEDGPDAIWMSQFLDCFSMDEIVDILIRARKVMKPHTRLLIMETLWDRQRYPTSAFCMTMTSLYFAAMANGNSKMYNTEDLTSCIRKAGFEVEKIHDNLGMGHSIVVCKV